MKSSSKPYVICLMCTSIDGKVLGRRWGKLPGWGDTNVFEKVHDEIVGDWDVAAWVVGTTTMKEFAGKPQRLKTASKGMKMIGFDDFVSNPGASSFGIGVDSKGVLRFQESETQGDHVVVLTTKAAGLDYLAHLRGAGVSYLVCGEREVDLKVAFGKLKSVLGLKQVMLEGGGTFNGSVLQAGLVDEIQQVIVPVVDGGGPGVTGMFDYPGKAPGKAVGTLKLKSVKEMKGGVVRLRYVMG